MSLPRPRTNNTQPTGHTDDTCSIGFKWREGLMRFRSAIVASALVSSAIALTLAGCARNEAATVSAAPQAPQVSVAEVLKRAVTDYDEFTGRFVAVERVEVRPRVSGYISSVSLTPGREVKKGDLLFT